MMRITPGPRSPGDTTERRRALELGDTAATDRREPFVERRGMMPAATATPVVSAPAALMAGWDAATAAPSDGPRNLGRFIERTAAPSRAFDATFINEAAEPGLDLRAQESTRGMLRAMTAAARPQGSLAADALTAATAAIGGDALARLPTGPAPAVQPGPPVFDQQTLDHPCIRHLDAASAFDYARAFLDHQRRSGHLPTPGSPGAALARDLKAAVAAVARYEHTAFGRALFNPDEVAQQVHAVMARHAR